MMHLDDFRYFILRELKRRQAKNAAYSVSAYARDLQMSVQKLSQVLNGKTGLSPSAAEVVGKKINLHDTEFDLFLALVSAKHHRRREERKEALERVAAIRAQFGFQEVSPDEIIPISDWYHWAAYLLVDNEEFVPDMTWVAKRLGISEETATEAYDNLFKAKLLRKDVDGNWSRTSKKFAFASKNPSKQLRDLYRQLLTKAESTLDGEKMENRHFHMSVLSISEEDRDLVKKRIDTFMRQLIDEVAERAQPTNRVYSVFCQFFPLDKVNGEPK